MRELDTLHIREIANALLPFIELMERNQKYSQTSKRGVIRRLKELVEEVKELEVALEKFVDDRGGMEDVRLEYGDILGVTLSLIFTMNDMGFNLEETYQSLLLKFQQRKPYIFDEWDKEAPTVQEEHDMWEKGKDAGA